MPRSQKIDLEQKRLDYIARLVDINLDVKLSKRLDSLLFPAATHPPMPTAMTVEELAKRLREAEANPDFVTHEEFVKEMAKW